MSKKQDYTVKADGWVAGKWRARGSIVSLTAVEAKYENVTPGKSNSPKAKPINSDDPTIKSSGLTDKAEAAEDKQSRAKK